MSSPFQKSFCGKSPLKQRKEETSLNQKEYSQDLKREKRRPGFAEKPVGGIQKEAASNKKKALDSINKPKAPKLSPLNQEVDSKKKVYQDSIQNLHKPAHEAYVKKQIEGYSISDDDGQTFNEIPPQTDPTKVKNLKDFAYTMEIGKGGSVKKDGVAASKLARMYK